MTRSEFLIECVLSLNHGGAGVTVYRVDSAIKQYDQLVEEGVIFDEEETEE